MGLLDTIPDLVSSSSFANNGVGSTKVEYAWLPGVAEGANAEL